MVFSFLLFLSFSPSCLAQQVEAIPVSEKHPDFAEKINDHFYRGSQPNGKGVRSLQKLGITMMIDLRGEFRRESAHEKKKRNLSA